MIGPVRSELAAIGVRAGARREGRARHAVVLALVLVTSVLGTACRAPLTAELGGLRSRSRLDYSVWVTGGAFVPVSGVAQGRDPYARTFDVVPGDDKGSPDRAEAIPLEVLAGVLESAEVFVRLERDARDAVERAAAGPLDEDLMRRVRESGHDLILTILPIDDGPIDDQGINDRWPVTVLTWLAIGLGMVIPDRTFESRATLQIALVDPWSGRQLYSEALGAGPVELALVDRAGLLGLVASIVIPPFWVASNREKVERHVRRECERRLALGLARRLKRVATEEQIRSRRPVDFAIERTTDGGLRIDVRSREALSFVVAQVDGTTVAGPGFAGFQQALLESRSPIGPPPGSERASGAVGFRYEAVWRPVDALDPDARLQLLAQSVAGRVGSTTRRVGDL